MGLNIREALQETKNKAKTIGRNIDNKGFDEFFYKKDDEKLRRLLGTFAMGIPGMSGKDRTHKAMFTILGFLFVLAGATAISEQFYPSQKLQPVKIENPLALDNGKIIKYGPTRTPTLPIPTSTFTPQPTQVPLEVPPHSTATPNYDAYLFPVNAQADGSLIEFSTRVPTQIPEATPTMQPTQVQETLPTLQPLPTIEVDSNTLPEPTKGYRWVSSMVGLNGRQVARNIPEILAFFPKNTPPYYVRHADGKLEKIENITQQLLPTDKFCVQIEIE